MECSLDEHLIVVLRLHFVWVLLTSVHGHSVVWSQDGGLKPKWRIEDKMADHPDDRALNVVYGVRLMVLAVSRWRYNVWQSGHVEWHVKEATVFNVTESAISILLATMSMMNRVTAICWTIFQYSIVHHNNNFETTVKRSTWQNPVG